MRKSVEIIIKQILLEITQKRRVQFVGKLKTIENIMGFSF